MIEMVNEVIFDLLRSHPRLCAIIAGAIASPILSALIR